uniref:Uncharacterized protein n=1 Tax=Arundo donax TaxID=35708 RepID=A0A0A9D9A5_ARUDO
MQQQQHPSHSSEAAAIVPPLLTLPPASATKYSSRHPTTIIKPPFRGPIHRPPSRSSLSWQPVVQPLPVGEVQIPSVMAPSPSSSSPPIIIASKHPCPGRHPSRYAHRGGSICRCRGIHCRRGTILRRRRSPVLYLAGRNRGHLPSQNRAARLHRAAFTSRGSVGVVHRHHLQSAAGDCTSKG